MAATTVQILVTMHIDPVPGLMGDEDSVLINVKQALESRLHSYVKDVVLAEYVEVPYPAYIVKES